MKRIITYFYILGAVLTAGVSCTREAIGGNQEDGAITLCFKTEEMSTRVSVNENAGKEAGKEAENTIEYVDYFFFADTDPDTPAIKSGRLSVDDLTKVSETEYTYRFDTENSEYEALKNKSYLYVLANYPGTIQETTLNGLLSMPISTDFSEEQTSFVMDSYDNGDSTGLLTLAPNHKDDAQTVVVKLTRCAAKIVLNIDVKNTFEDEAGNIWKPVTNQMKVNFVNARNRTTVDAEAVAFDDKNFFYSTDSKAPAAVTAVDAEHTSWQAEAVYTYPQAFNVSDITAPYFKIFCPWVCDGKGTNNFYYKILLPKLGSFQRNKIYKMTVDVSVIGSTEDDWALATNYIAVVDWWSPETIEASFEGAMYLDVPVKYYEIYGANDIYIPVLSSNDIQVLGASGNTVTGTKTNLYDSSNQTITPTISEVSKDGFKLTHVLNTDITSPDYDCTPITYTMRVRHTTGGLSRTVDVTVIQYPSVYVEADPSNGSVFVNGQGYDSRVGGQVYNNTYSTARRYTYRIRNGSYERTNTRIYVDYYGSLGTVQDPNNMTGTNNTNKNQYIVHVSVLPDGSDYVIGDPRYGGTAVNNLGYRTYSLTSATQYYVPDENNESIMTYYERTFSSTNDNTVSARYKSTGENTQNVIAPAFKIASSYGKTTPLSYQSAKERCAAYQENGYPAGRWRLPTVAEIDFLIRLSENNHMPTLFDPGYDDYSDGSRVWAEYWAGGGWAYLGKKSYMGESVPAFDFSSTGTKSHDGVTYTVSNYGSIGYSVRYNNNTYNNNIWARCVYDVWYWGDEPYSENATTWLGYQMD